MTKASRVRCAIYTRKSTDEGLDQTFNTLEAQREACTAYIASQRHEGWKALSTRYDDGGFSGGSLDRPALQRLMQDIDEGRVDMVVVYKIDRLTRSLADFAKLVDRLDSAGTSFVSVTQAFNTSTSMGRLTLNVLLSFAQFEREVTAERIRDKIAASKKKGLWMGGHTPLGYDAHPDPQKRELVVNQHEAADIRTIFQLYAEHGNLRIVADDANARGIRSKRRVFSSGRRQGGSILSRGQIHHILTNPIYIGKIRHKEKVWPGLHQAIIDEHLWSNVQEKLTSARQRRGSGTATSKSSPLLVGKLKDETGDRLTPTYTKSKTRRFRYYVSNRLLSGEKDSSGWRLPGPALEKSVADLIADHIADLSDQHGILLTPHAATAEHLGIAAHRLATNLRQQRESVLYQILKSGELGQRQIHLVLEAQFLATELQVEKDQLSPAILTIDAPLELRRRGQETRIIAGRLKPAPDRSLLERLLEAHQWVDDLKAGTPLSRLAAQKGCTGAYIRTRAQLAFLSPKIQTAILQGSQPPELSVHDIIRKGVPLDWKEQETLFGFSR